MRLLFFLFFLTSLLNAEISFVNLSPPKIKEITLEHAQTPDQLTWGLMQRTLLPKDAGMLFYYPNNDYHSLWMYNTLIDLSAAFLDSQGVIREIHEMKAYPKFFKRRQTVRQVQNLFLADPIVQFFRNRRVSSRFPAKYALEMNKQWFKRNQIKTGDVLMWNRAKASVLEAIDPSPNLSTEATSLFFELAQPTPLALWLPEKEENYHVIFFDSQGKPVHSGVLRGGKNISLKPVLYSVLSIKYFMMLPTKMTLSRDTKQKKQ